MPLGNNVSKNIKELYADNKKTGKARGANGKLRGRAQIIAIAMDAAKRAKKKKKMVAQPQMMAKKKRKNGR